MCVNVAVNLSTTCFFITPTLPFSVSQCRSKYLLVHSSRFSVTGKWNSTTVGFPWTSNSNVHISNPAEFSGPFISFLSGSLTSLQGGFEQSSNVKPVFTVNEKPINRNNANGCASRSGPVLVPAVELSQYFSSHKLKFGETLKSTAVIDPPKCEMAKPAAPSHYVGDWKLKHSSFPRGASDAGSISDSAVKFNDIPDTVTSRKVFLETGYSRQLSPLLSNYLRVFCLGLSGCLVLRNTCLLGVICFVMVHICLFLGFVSSLVYLMLIQGMLFVWTVV